MSTQVRYEVLNPVPPCGELKWETCSKEIYDKYKDCQKGSVTRILGSIEIGATVWHKEIYWGREPMKIIGIRGDAVELQGDYSGGTHNVCQASWMSKDGLIFEPPVYNSNQKQQP